MDGLPHRLLGAVRRPEVALGRLADPAGIATQEGPVEAELLVDDDDLIGRGGLTDDGERRVAGCEVEQETREQRHEKEHDEQVQQATAYESRQGGSQVSALGRREA